jgi:ATP-binding cassette subfamily B protein
MTAHRLSTILEADWIVVLDGGRVVGSGTHEVLISTCSQYVELVSSQTTLADSAFDVDGRTARTTVPDGEIRA